MSKIYINVPSLSSKSLTTKATRLKVKLLSTSAETSDWYGTLTKDQQAAYIKDHPNSKYAKQHAVASHDSVKKEVSSALKKVKPSALSDAAKAIKNGFKKAVGDTTKLAGTTAALAVLGPIGGAIKAAKIGALVGAVAPSVTVAGGVVSGAAIGAAVGAAPAALLAVLGAGVIAHKTIKNAKENYKALRSQSSDDDLKTVEDFVHKVLDYIKTKGLTKEQAEKLVELCKIKPSAPAAA